MLHNQHGFLCKYCRCRYILKPMCWSVHISVRTRKGSTGLSSIPALHWCWTTTYVLEIASQDSCWLRSLMGLIWQFVLCVNRGHFSGYTAASSKYSSKQARGRCENGSGGSQRWECRKTSRDSGERGPGRDSSQLRTEEWLQTTERPGCFQPDLSELGIFYNQAVTASLAWILL